jgi:hypothetical protein
VTAEESAVPKIIPATKPNAAIVVFELMDDEGSRYVKNKNNDATYDSQFSRI